MDRNGIEQLIARQADAWQRADVDAIGADFAEDGLFISPGGRWQGPEAIMQTAREFFVVCSEVQVEIRRILLDSNQGAIEWVWHETRKDDGQTYTMEDAIIFELRDGQIIYWREYFEPI
ncbi:MAG: nuclear transport factor 2 family protein [Chloroflexota bacterium]